MHPSYDPYRDGIYKVNTYLIESVARNDKFESFDIWMFLKAYDEQKHGAPTGRVYNIAATVTALASKMGCSKQTVRRNLRTADAEHFIHLDRDGDVVRIRNRAKITVDLWRHDLGGVAPDGSVLPDEHTRHLHNVLEVSVRIPEVYDADSKSMSESKKLDIVRQRCVELGWCRESFARLIGRSRTSTARTDRTVKNKRGWQLAYVTLSDITKSRDTNLHESVAKQIIEQYRHFAPVLTGRGRKLWSGRDQSGDWVLYTQSSVKWETPFRGRLKFDEDVRELSTKVISSSVLGECRSLHPVVEPDNRGENAARGVGVMSESMRQSIWKTLAALEDGVGGHKINIKPIVRFMDLTSWTLPFSRSSESPNQEIKNLKENFLLAGESVEVFS
jgi:hypothetical protein